MNMPDEELSAEIHAEIDRSNAATDELLKQLHLGDNIDGNLVVVLDIPNK